MRQRMRKCWVHAHAYKCKYRKCKKKNIVKKSFTYISTYMLPPYATLLHIRAGMLGTIVIQIHRKEWKRNRNTASHSVQHAGERTTTIICLTIYWQGKKCKQKFHKSSRVRRSRRGAVVRCSGVRVKAKKSETPTKCKRKRKNMNSQRKWTTIATTTTTHLFDSRPRPMRTERNTNAYKQPATQIAIAAHTCTPITRCNDTHALICIWMCICMCACEI